MVALKSEERNCFFSPINCQLASVRRRIQPNNLFSRVARLWE